MKTTAITLSLAALFGAELYAQSPGAFWSRTTGVTGTVPSQRRESPGAASATKMYVFGGRSGNSGGTVLNDLYEFDGKVWTELTKNAATGSPPARDRAGICWDFSRNKLIVFGGQGATSRLNDTWEFDPVTKAWKDITPASGNPPARSWTSIAYDPASRSIVMFGGLNAAGVHLNDTWRLVGGSVWIKVNSTATPPTRRQHHLLTRQDAGDVLLVAGQNTSLSAPSKWRTGVWRFTNLNWVQLTTTGRPAAVVANDATYDEVRKRIVMPGGNGILGGSPTGEITEFDTVSNTWIIRRGRTSPDPVLGRVSRFFLAFVPSLGKSFKISGQQGIASPTTTVEYQTDEVASETVGSPGCTSAAGTPALSATSAAWLGRNMVLDVKNTPATAASVLAVGASTTSLPLSLFNLGPASCVFTVTPLFLVPMAKNASGDPEITLPVPLDNSLATAPPLLTQCLVITGATSAVVSNRLDVKFGAL